MFFRPEPLSTEFWTFLGRIVKLRKFTWTLVSTYLRRESIPHFDSLHLDTSLTGLWGTWNNRVYATPVLGIPGFQLRIVHLEMFNIVIALRLWAKFLACLYVKIFCDPLAVVRVVRTSKTRDQFLAACIRNIRLISATWDIKLDINHIPGKRNNTTDLLSKLYSQAPVNNNFLYHLQTNYIWDRVPLKFFNINFNI